MPFANYADEIKFMTVDKASRRLGQIADELDAREKALEDRVKIVEERLKLAEARLASCCSEAGLKSPSVPVPIASASSNNPE